MRVPIAEDSVVVAERIEAMVSDLERGIDLVGRAADVPGAIEAVRSLCPDVVILDIRMPGGSGIDALELIKRNDPRPS